MTSRHGTPPPARPPDESMALLTEVERQPVDPDYAQSALRRDQPGPRQSTPGRVLIAAVAVLLGIGVSGAALILRNPTDGALAARTALEGQVRDGRNEVAALTEQNLALATQIAALQREALGADDPELLDQATLWSALAGTAAVTGPGLRVVLSDSTSDVAGDDGRVQDMDLQVVVNGLWAAGAEAIAVNGQRLTSTSAIRSAGSAVLVDLVPLITPYTVDAIGDAPTMQTDLASSSAGQHLAMLRGTYGIGVDITSQQRLSLPATGVATLRAAQVPQDVLVAAGLADAPAAGVSGSASDREGVGQ